MNYAFKVGELYGRWVAWWKYPDKDVTWGPFGSEEEAKEWSNRHAKEIEAAAPSGSPITRAMRRRNLSRSKGRKRSAGRRKR